MRIAVISDIHGNLVALDAVLAALTGDQIDEIVCLGDVLLRGPQPVECLTKIRELECPVILGNTDEWMTAKNPSWHVPDQHDPVMDIDLWCAAQIGESDREFLRTFQPTHYIRGEQTSGILFFHGSPRSNTENMLAITPESDIDDMIRGQAATILVGGHTHIQLLRRKYDKVIVNVGSVGLPFLVDRLDSREPVHSTVAPWAEYAIIDSNAGRVSVDFRRVPIDLQHLERAVFASKMPHAQWWLGKRDRQLASGRA